MNALNAYNKLNTNVAGLKKSSEKLSSGYRINRAGDDAAGLAISEKMRSQIRGLNQAKRNSQDGISMIQTFEGATQESHSILQRMKELASESANGTYQDEVDRDAIQLEFNQLNDELDQIADTDFNGVVMLNGGQMADGTKAVAGKFDYANQVRQAKQLSAKSKEFNTLDNKTWDENADDAWAKWSDGAGKYDRNDKTQAQGPDSVDITFTYKGDGTWEATGVSDGGMTLANINDTIKYNKFDANNAASNGGFSLVNGNKEYANVVLDNTKLVAGDKITLTFNNPNVKNTAPENIGVKTDGVDTTGLTDAGFAPINPDNLTVKITNTTHTSTNNTTTTAIDEKTAELFKAIDGSSLSLTYADGKITGVSFGANNGTTAVTATDGGTNIVNAAGTVLGKIKVDDATDTTAITITDAAGNELAVITPVAGDTTGDAANAGAHKTAGTIKYTLATSDTVFNKGAEPTVKVKDNGDTSVSEANSNGAATAPLTYTDHMVLQTGSRTKDSVDFTFKYATNGMGDLKANLDLSSRTNGLGTKDLSLSTQKDANSAIDKIDNAINKVSMVRATFGATQNRLEHKIENLTTNSENLTEAESTIRDTDMASEMLNYTKYNVLQQAAQSMLAQANQQPQSILQLLG